MRRRGCSGASVDLEAARAVVAYEPELIERRRHPFGHRRHRVHGDAGRLRGSPVVTAPAPSRTDGEGEPTLTTAELELEGMHCSACATRIQRSLGRLPAVASASVNLATTRAFVSYDADRIGLEGLCQAVADVGYSASPTTTDGGDHRARTPTTGSAGGHLVAAGHCRCRCRPRWRRRRPRPAGPSWCLAVIVEIAGGWPFLRNSARLLRHGGTSMDTLIALGTLAALAVSAVEAIALGGRHVHLGGSGDFAARLHGVMSPLIVAILATGRAVEAKARDRASRAMHSLLSLRPPTARMVATPEDEVGRTGFARERARRVRW